MSEEGKTSDRSENPPSRAGGRRTRSQRTLDGLGILLVAGGLLLVCHSASSRVFSAGDSKGISVTAGVLFGLSCLRRCLLALE
jgi:hypothetical protein